MNLTKQINIKKLILTFAVASILALSIGCSKVSQNPISNTPIKEQQDQDLTKKLTSENIVQSGKVYLAGTEAIATITVKKGTDEKTIKDMATKYANAMKQKYSNKKIHVVAFLEGKEVANILL